jgi:hypothetical protein
LPVKKDHPHKNWLKTKLIFEHEINDVTLDGSISFLWWSWVGWLGHDGRSTRVLTSIGQSEGSSKF